MSTEASPTPPTGIDGKYGRIWSEKKQFHDGEPIFLIRAQDPLAPHAIETYARLCEAASCDAHHVSEVFAQADRVAAWQAEHPELVKDRPGPLRTPTSEGEQSLNRDPLGTVPVDPSFPDE